MNALVLTEEKQLPQYIEMQKPTPKKGEALVNIEAAALNHRDVWITKGLYPNIHTPTILGSDGAGRVGERKVIINPNIDWGDDEAVQTLYYQILGMPENGTFAEYIVVEEDRLHDMPEHLSMEEAAALPLGGLTAFRATFTKCQIKKGDKVLISGVGGGVALFACQFAIATGAEVYVTSSSEAKIQRAIELGAKGGFLYTDENWTKQLRKEIGGVDAIIDSAAGDGFANFVKICNPAARICFYGGTRGKINNLNPQLMFWKQISIFGSTMGSDKEFGEMVEFVREHKIKPVIDQIYDLKDGVEAFKRMDAGQQFGKLVLKI
ncbi:MAG: zinc-binding dehydrogenase [Bacteroidota bacterium]